MEVTDLLAFLLGLVPFVSALLGHLSFAAALLTFHLGLGPSLCVLLYFHFGLFPLAAAPLAVVPVLLLLRSSELTTCLYNPLGTNDRFYTGVGPKSTVC